MFPFEIFSVLPYFTVQLIFFHRFIFKLRFPVSPISLSTLLTIISTLFISSGFMNLYCITLETFSDKQNAPFYYLVHGLLTEIKEIIT